MRSGGPDQIETEYFDACKYENRYTLDDPTNTQVVNVLLAIDAFNSPMWKKNPPIFFGTFVWYLIKH